MSTLLDLNSLTDIQDELRRRLDEAVPGQFSTANLNAYINQAAYRVAKELNCIRRRARFVLRDQTREYNLTPYRLIGTIDQLRVTNQYEYEDQVTSIRTRARGFRVGVGPTGVAYSTHPAASGLSQIPLATMTPAAFWQPSWSYPWDMAFDPEGIFVYVSTASSVASAGTYTAGTKIYKWDTRSGTWNASATLPTISGTQPKAVEIAYDTSRGLFEQNNYVWFADETASASIYRLRSLDFDAQVASSGSANYVRQIQTGAYQGVELQLDNARRYGMYLANNTSASSRLYNFDLDAGTATASYNLPNAASHMWFYTNPSEIPSASAAVYTARVSSGSLVIDKYNPATMASAFSTTITQAQTSASVVAVTGITFSEATGQVVVAVDNKLVLAKDEAAQSSSGASFTWNKNIILPGQAYRPVYDYRSGSLLCANVVGSEIWRLDLRAVSDDDGDTYPIIPSSELYQYGSGEWACLLEETDGSHTLRFANKLSGQNLVTMRYVSAPNPLNSASAVTDIPHPYRERIVQEAEILANEMIRRDASWLKTKLEDDYSGDKAREDKGASTYSFISSNDYLY